MSQLKNIPRSINPMRIPQIEKVVVNISVGKSGEPLQKAMNILKQLTGQTPSQRKAKKTIRDWGIHKKEAIACLVTLRGNISQNFLKKAFDAVGNKLFISNFDINGNFAFGIKKHIDIPGIKYDPKLGIVGMNVCVKMGKPGNRVKKRRIGRAKIGKQQRLRKNESIEYIKETFGIEIMGE